MLFFNLEGNENNRRLQIKTYHNAIALKMSMVTFSLSGSQLLLCSVKIVDISGMMLAVMEAHDLPADYRLQRTILIR